MNSSSTRASSTNLSGIASFWPRAVQASLLISLWAGTAYAQAPTVVSVRPVRNARSAPRTTPVTVRFSQPLNTTTATPQAFKVFSQQAGGRKAGTITSNRDTISLRPTTPFKAGETVFATVTTAVRSNNDQPLEKPQVFQFTTAVTRSAGTFISGPPDLALSSLANLTTLGDVDGDGDLDLLVAGNYSDAPRAVRVRLNNGGGVFSGNQEVSVGYQPAAVVLGDIDSDGDLDLLSAGAAGFSSPGTVSVRLNNGSGAFSNTGQEISVGNTPLSISLADLDGDGDLDLVAGNNGSSFVSIRFNNGLGSFSGNQEVSVRSGTTDIAVGDVDNDGDLDVLAISPSSPASVSVRLNNGAGIFTNGTDVSNVGVNANKLRIGDLDNDGDLDFMTMGMYVNSSTALVFKNKGDGTFDYSENFLAAYNSQSAALADVEGDGDLDFIAVSLGNVDNVRIALNNGAGSFTASTFVTVGFGPTSISFGDLDENGTLDFVTINPVPNTINVRLNSQVLATKSAQKTGPLSLYPNPARGSVRLQLPAGYTHQNGRVSLINALGQVVFEQALNTTTPELALPNLASGIYTVQLTTSQGNLASRLLVE